MHSLDGHLPAIQDLIIFLRWAPCPILLDPNISLTCSIKIFNVFLFKIEGGFLDFEELIHRVSCIAAFYFKTFSSKCL